MLHVPPPQDGHQLSERAARPRAEQALTTSRGTTMTFEDLRSATAHAIRDERLRRAELSRRTRLQQAEARARAKEDRKPPRPRRA